MCIVRAAVEWTLFHGSKVSQAEGGELLTIRSHASRVHRYIQRPRPAAEKGMLSVSEVVNRPRCRSRGLERAKEKSANFFECVNSHEQDVVFPNREWA